MRAKLIISAAVVALLGLAGPAMANYFYPGSVIIGYGPIMPPIKTNSANAMVGPECQLKAEVHCECFPGATVLEACEKSQVDIGCLTPDMKHIGIFQQEEVVTDQGESTLGTAICTGKADGLAYVLLPKPKG